ncbi:NEAT domain-containing protein [Secundilactobacillus folii]|nr:NEAT domain-containing protein [Secundilactobacillus folii]
MKRLKWLIGTIALVLLGFLFTLPMTAHAQSINYRSLVYGTNKNSMASPYFVKPASVKVVNHKYVVTMHIRTAKKLHSFPVKMIWVDGETPQNVRRVKDRSGNSNLFYSFSTRNLNKRVNAKLAVDVPGVYKAKHLITFKFSTVGLPSLQSNSATKQTTTQSKGNRTAGNKVKAKSPSVIKKQANKQKNRQSKPNQASKATNKPAKKASSSSNASKTSSNSAQPSSSTKTNSADNKDHSNNHSRVAFLIVGVVVIVAVVIGGSLVVMRRKH